MRILIIDDYENMCKSMELLMQSTYEHSIVSWITEPERTEETIKNFQPDIIIIDFEMPGSNGDEVIRKNKKLINSMNIKVILYSSYDIKPSVCEDICGFMNGFQADKLQSKGDIETVINQAYHIKQIEDMNKDLKKQIKTLKKINK
jgi:DNA-binding NarL/FixJ family response regulator